MPICGAIWGSSGHARADSQVRSVVEGRHWSVFQDLHKVSRLAQMDDSSALDLSKYVSSSIEANCFVVKIAVAGSEKIPCCARYALLQRSCWRSTVESQKNHLSICYRDAMYPAVLEINSLGSFLYLLLLQQC